ncbi:hypothetical protein BOX15_Mlig007036g1 [Macrostomum lignano]|uniref:Uncharacterized protein n=2 Tax=Macrostomum lignano TaxID=282301 RepID=A0A267FDM1_9PLAT|nr:hypothetical protein BOX15_Mlig007036g1 [Macrostomum lignano]
MSRMMQGQQKIGEKLYILNDRLNGMMARLHFVREASKRYKSDLLSEKTLDKACKDLLRRFPTIDLRSGSANLTALVNRREDFIKTLSICYVAFLDILDVKDHISELLTRMDASGIHLNAELNTEMTFQYLDLVANYIATMIMFSQFEDKKLLVAIYVLCLESKTGAQEKQFPRLAQLMLDYDQPTHTMRRLQDEFVPHSRLLCPALMSLRGICSRRFLRAENWRAVQFLSLLKEPSSLVNALSSDILALEVVSQERLERWLVLGFVVIHPQLNDEEPFNLWKQALLSSWVLPLYRDQVIQTHSFIISFFDTIRNYSRRVNEVKEWHTQVCQQGPEVHRERRKYLRNILKELCLIFSDQPGLLGPKVLYLLMTLSYCRDEVLWFLRHGVHPSGAGKLRQKAGQNAGDSMQDRFLPEFIYHMEELRQLVRKYHQVIQRFNVQTLINWDSVLLERELKGALGSTLMEEDASMLSDVLQKLSSLTVKQVEDKEPIQLSDVRIDWLRLQAKLSSSSGVPSIRECDPFAKHMNSAAFHTRLIDDLDGVLAETSSLHLFFFYDDFLIQMFNLNIEFPAQHRYITVFPQICTHYTTLTHPLCPEETALVAERAFERALSFVRNICHEIIQLVICVFEEQTQLSYRLLPKMAAIKMMPLPAPNAGKKSQAAAALASAAAAEVPGTESQRKRRENMTSIDKYRMALSELCCSLHNCRTVNFQYRSIVPREVLTAELEQKFCKTIVASQMYNAEREEIAKPSELLSCLKASLGVLQDLDCFMTLDLPRVFNMVLLQQTQLRDSWRGDQTITHNYIAWYCGALLPKVVADSPRVIYSPRFKSFLMMDPNQPFPIEEYADYNEICALAELIGPYGMKYLDEEVCKLVAAEIEEAKKLVMANMEVLQALRVSFEDPTRMSELSGRLQQPVEFLCRFKNAGVYLSFRRLCQEGLNSVMQKRSPFLIKTAEDLLGDRGEVTALFRSGMGLDSSVDLGLLQALERLKGKPEQEYMLVCHMLVFLSVSLPRLAALDNTVYGHDVEAHYNNTHTIAGALNSVLPALLTLCTPQQLSVELGDRWKEFLALCSSSLLRASQDELTGRNLPSVFIILDLIVKQCPYLTASLLEMCFPYALIRQAYNAVGSARRPVASHHQS